MAPEEQIDGNASLWELAIAVRDACYQAAIEAYEDARSDGLCHDGAWECGIAAMRSLAMEAVLARAMQSRAAAQQDRGR